MTSHINLARIAVILLFAMTFTLVGWTAPVIYASNVPADDVIQVHNFEAQDTTVNSDQHYVCFDRTVHQGTSATVFTELYLLNENGERVEVDSSTMDRYFQQGRSTVVTPFELPDNLQEGKYRYVLVAQMNMADGRVTRDFQFESERFTVRDDAASEMTRPENC